MASWKPFVFLLLAILVVFALQAEANRGRGGRRRGGGGRRTNALGGGGRRQGGGRRGNRGNSGISTGTDDSGSDPVESPDVDPPMTPPRRGGPGGGRRGGRRPGRRPGRGRPGRRGGGRGGRRRGGGGRRRGGRRGEPQDGSRLLRDYSLANGHFGLRVYKEMANNADNFVISPLSIHSAMSMLVLGAAGSTKQELITGLHIQSPIHPAFQTYNNSLEFNPEGDAVLAMANALYSRPGFNLKPRFVNKLRMFYGSMVARFAEDQPEAAINNWVNQKTMGKITDFLSDGEVTDDMVMMLINAIYFKGLWKDAFDEGDTRLETFTDANSVTSDVYMMIREGQYKVFVSQDLDCSVLKLPYKGDRYSLNIFLPSEDSDLQTLESRLTHTVINQTLHNLGIGGSDNYHIHIPKINLDTEESMKELLQALGINQAFESTANFRKMTQSQVAVSKVKHRCIIEMDERGTEAAAATGVGIARVSLPLPPQHFKANRPFMFVLRDDQTSVNLFMGRYVNPQGDNLA